MRKTVQTCLCGKMPVWEKDSASLAKILPIRLSCPDDHFNIVEYAEYGVDASPYEIYEGMESRAVTRWNDTMDMLKGLAREFVEREEFGILDGLTPEERIKLMDSMSNISDAARGEGRISNEI